MANDPHSMDDILDALCELGEEQDKVAIGDVVSRFGNRSYGPFLIVPALIELSPIGGIPGLPTFLALIIAIVAVQMLIGRHHLWLPGFVARRSVAGEKLAKAVSKLRGIGRWMDRWFHGRLPRFARGPFVKVAAVAVIALCLTVPPLELVPFASSAPMATIAVIGLALLVGDGLLMIIAGVLAIAAAGFGIGMIGSGGGGG